MPSPLRRNRTSAMPSPLKSATPTMRQSTPTAPSRFAAATWTPFISYSKSCPSVRRNRRSLLASPLKSPSCEAAEQALGLTGGMTVNNAVRVTLPWPLVVLVKLIVAAWLPEPRLLAAAFSVNVTFVGEVAAVPEVADALSQLGTPEPNWMEIG